MTGWFRINEWWNSKIVALIGLSYLFALSSGLPIHTFLPILSFLLIWMLLSATLGYYINDVFDLEQDLKVKKENKSVNHTALQKTVLIILLILGILVNWYLLSGDHSVLVLILSQIILFLLYSSPVLRLKEKPRIGVLVDAWYAHLIPGLVVFVSIANPEFRSASFIIFCIWQTSAGIRNILAHHLVDFSNDTNSNTTTSATFFGKAIVRKTMNFIVSPLEVLSFIGLLILLKSPVSFIALAYIAYIIYVYHRELIFLRQNKTSWSIREQETYNFIGGVLLNELYERWFPIISLGMLCYINPWFIILTAIHFIIFYNTIMEFKKDYMILKNIIISQIYWWFIANLYKYFLHPVYYSFFGRIKHFVYWKIYSKFKDFLYWQLWCFLYYKVYGKFKHYIYWNYIKTPKENDKGQ